MSVKHTNTRRELVTASTLGAGALLALALLIIVNYFGWKYHQRWDWTSSQLYTLSEKSVSVMEDLDRDVEAVVFLSPGDVELYGPATELLARYEALSQRFSYRTLDPEKNPAEAQALVDRYQVSALNVVVFDSGDDRRVVESSDMAEYDYSGMQFGQGPKLESFKGEQVFTAAILELAEDRKPRILFTTGHGELELDDPSGRGLSSAQDLLGRDNFEIDSWASLGQPSVPEGTDLLVVAGPGSGFLEPEVQVLRTYIEGGGRLLVLLDPILSDTGALAGSGLDGLLAGYGVALGNDLVVDPANPLPFYGAETFFVNDFGDHRITRSLRQTQLPVVFALASSVTAGTAAEGLLATELLRTSADGWGETDLENLQAVELGDDDLAGPVSLGVAVESAAEGEDEESELAETDAGEAESGGGQGEAPAIRLVVIGDSDFASNSQLPNVGNAELLANTMNWLVERETLLGIPPKEPEQVRLSLTEGQLRWVNWLILVIMPGLAIALGVAVYFRRRR
jgi:ABC-type uncharacterized transport system involved in gliding motility auxiliary subunit